MRADGAVCPQPGRERAFSLVPHGVARADGLAAHGGVGPGLEEQLHHLRGGRQRRLLHFGPA